MTLIDDFVASFDVWEVARPYLALMVNEAEMELIVAMQGQALTVEAVADRLALPVDSAATLLERAYRRCLLDRTVENQTTRYSPTDFGHRLDHFAKYENWDDIPADAREAINRAFLDRFIAQHRPNVERKMAGLESQHSLPNDTVMLLTEVEAMIETATHIVVQPCDCRRLGQNCNRPVETCIWLDDGALATLERGHGRRLTKAEAKKLVRRADQKGLMHTADSEWQSRGLHAICNCCACDCYPFRAAQELGSKGVWPRSRYLAVYDRAGCNFCGACVRRCHFEAFYHDGSLVEFEGRVKQNILFDPDRCWGCGLCANTCPLEAIEMVSLESGDD